MKKAAGVNSIKDVVDRFQTQGKTTQVICVIVLDRKKTKLYILRNTAFIMLSSYPLQFLK